MSLCMAGLDIHTAKLSIREAFSFSKEKIQHMLEKLRQREEISGAVLLVTCNRTELYLSVSEGNVASVSPAAILQSDAHVFVEKSVMTERTETETIRHLMEVACGLHSQILQDEQIISQVGDALELAKSCHSTDAMLNTLFRIAVSAGKAAQTEVCVPQMSASVSSRAVRELEKQTGELSRKSALVIGNGKMGRLVAEQLVKYGCKVFMTLRTYHAGESVIPFGVIPIPYENRYSQMNQTEIVISATRSPHCTIRKQELEALTKKPRWLLDLAVPRDIEPSCRTVSGITLWDLDEIGRDTESNVAVQSALRQIAAEYADAYRMWQNYRSSLPYMQQLKALIVQRILRSTAATPYRDLPQAEEIIQLAADKTVDMLMGCMKEQVSPEWMLQCCEKIKDRGRF